MTACSRSCCARVIAAIAACFGLPGSSWATRIMGALLPRARTGGPWDLRPIRRGLGRRSDFRRGAPAIRNVNPTANELYARATRAPSTPADSRCSRISNDVRDLLESDDPRARLALDYLVCGAHAGGVARP